MAERRMFAKTIIDSDAFLDMPMSSQALYFHLAMRADDDGFVNSPKRIQRLIGAADDDLKVLIAKQFVIAFENGIIVIKHWKMHNYIRTDRYKPTIYENEKSTLMLDNNGIYNGTDTKCIPMTAETDTNGIPNVHQRYPQDRLGKDRLELGKDSIEIEEPKRKAKRFTPPTLEEVTAYCIERNNSVDPQHFIDYYTSNGWLVGKNKMKDWKAAVRTWERNGYSNTKASKPNTKAQELDNFYNMASEWAESEGNV